MRLHYYVFDKSVPETVLLQEGCAVVLQSGSKVYVNSIPEDKRPLVAYIERCIGGLTITEVKRLMKKYGGNGYTEHIDRDGSVFEVTNIVLGGNNSRNKYNRHL